MSAVPLSCSTRSAPALFCFRPRSLQVSRLRQAHSCDLNISAECVETPDRQPTAVRHQESGGKQRLPSSGRQPRQPMAGHFTRVNHSGGSPGADAAWKEIGAEFGVRAPLCGMRSCCWTSARLGPCVRQRSFALLLLLHQTHGCCFHVIARLCCLFLQVGTRSYRPFDDPQPHDPTSVVLTRQQLSEAEPRILAADAQLGARFQVRHQHVCLQNACDSAWRVR